MLGTYSPLLQRILQKHKTVQDEKSHLLKESRAYQPSDDMQVVLNTSVISAASATKHTFIDSITKITYPSPSSFRKGNKWIDVCTTFQTTNQRSWCIKDGNSRLSTLRIETE